MKRGGVLEIYVFSWKGIRRIMSCDWENCARGEEECSGLKRIHRIRARDKDFGRE